MLVAIALAFASVSLTYPFSRDQGLFYYVGREWLQRGAIPYRDVFEQKTPFIFALHALLIAVAGENMWAIRLAEMVAIVVIGYSASRLAVIPERTSAPGTFGVATLAASVFYYGYFSFEDTANCEIWCVACSLASIAIARKAAPRWFVGGSSGMLMALATLAKPPGVWFLPFALGELGRRRAANVSAPWRAVAPFFLGFAGVWGAVLGYFAARGALADFIDVVVRANAFHAAHAGRIRSFAELVRLTAERIDWFSPLSYGSIFVACGAIAAGLFRTDRPFVVRYLYPVALACAAYGSVVIQLKFFAYHFAVFVAPFSVLAAMIYVDLAAHTRNLRTALPTIYVAILGIATWMVPADVWREHARRALQRLRGRLSREQLLDTFYSGATHVDIPNSFRAGDWIRTHSAPVDTLLVRGYEPQIYAIARRHFNGRFFWSTFLTSPSREYRRVQWISEDRATLERAPPRYVIAYETAAAPLDSVAWFSARGYMPQATFGEFVVMERGR